MFVSENLIYLQLQKTGCTQIAAILAENIIGEQIGKHNFLKDYNVDQNIVGSVRNPWTWYISLWAYGCEQKGTFYHLLTTKSVNELIRKLYHKEIIESFYELVKPTEIWKKNYIDSNDPECFRGWLKNVFDPERKMDLGEEYHKYNLNHFAGFYTHRYCRLHLKDYYKKASRNKISNYDNLLQYDVENNLLDHVIRMESLEDDLKKTLQLCGYNSSEIEENIVESRNKKRNTSKHREAGYYDEETIQMVAEKELFIIEKYRYEPPSLMK